MEEKCRSVDTREEEAFAGDGRKFMKHIRILHSSDLFLDASFAHLGCDSACGNRLRMAQMTVFDRLVARAKAWPADVLCIAGNLFDGMCSSRILLEHVIHGFEQLAPAQVYIAPGLYDAVAPNSPYAVEVWPQNVVIFQPDTWQSVEHPTLPLVVHGIGQGKKKDRDFAAPSFDALPRDDQLHIAVVSEKKEGSVCQSMFAEHEGPWEGLTYIALGGRAHKAAVETGNNTVAWYPGTPQGRSFDECGSRYALEVEIARSAGTASTAVSINAVGMAAILFEDLCMDSENSVPLNSLAGDKLPHDPRERVVHLRLQGKRPLLAEALIQELEKEGKDTFLHMVVSDEMTLDYDRSILPRANTCLSKLAAAMIAKIMDDPERDAALFETQALELILNAHSNKGLAHDNDMELPE